MKSMELNFEEIVENLNQELYDKFDETEHRFTYLTDGYVDVIMVGDYVLWNSDNDEREFDEKKNEYESFEPFIKRMFNEYADLLYSLKFKIPKNEIRTSE